MTAKNSFESPARLQKIQALSVEEYIATIGDPRHLQDRNFSEEEIAGFWADLNDVGTKKAIGYLPMDTLVYICGVLDVNKLAAEYEQKGLKTKFRSQGLGSLMVWDKKMLQRELNRNAKLLQNSGWPQNADQFIEQVSDVVAERGPLYDFIARLYNDARYHSQNTE